MTQTRHKKTNRSPDEINRIRAAQKKIGSLFREIRTKNRFSADYVARYVGSISSETIELYETGDRGIPLKHIYAISNCLNISPDQIQRILSEKKASK